MRIVYPKHKAENHYRSSYIVLDKILELLRLKVLQDIAETWRVSDIDNATSDVYIFVGVNPLLAETNMTNRVVFHDDRVLQQRLQIWVDFFKFTCPDMNRLTPSNQ